MKNNTEKLTRARRRFVEGKENLIEFTARYRNQDLWTHSIHQTHYTLRPLRRPLLRPCHCHHSTPRLLGRPWRWSRRSRGQEERSVRLLA